MCRAPELPMNRLIYLQLWFGLFPKGRGGGGQFKEVLHLGLFLVRKCLKQLIRFHELYLNIQARR